MIAELFYPKELKELIVKLKAEDALNEGALKEINNVFYFIGLLSLLSLYAVYNIFPSFILLVLGISSIILYLYRDLHRSFYNDIIPYTMGHTSWGCVDKKYNDYIHGVLTIRYSVQTGKKRIARKIVCTNKKEWDEVPLGRILVFSYPKDSEFHSAFLPVRFGAMCLDENVIRTHLSQGNE